MFMLAMAICRPRWRNKTRRRTHEIRRRQTQTIAPNPRDDPTVSSESLLVLCTIVPSGPSISSPSFYRFLSFSQFSAPPHPPRICSLSFVIHKSLLLIKSQKYE